MKAVLVVALVASVAVNVWLVSDRGGGDVEIRTVKTAAVYDVVERAPSKLRASSSADGAGDREAAAKRIAELEAELAVAKDKAAQFDAMDPLGRLIYAKGDLSSKLHELLKIPEKERWSAMGKLAQALKERAGGVDEMLATLRTESDPEALKVLMYVLASGLSGQKTTPEQRAQFSEILRTGDLPARRVAAAWAVSGTQSNNAMQGAEPNPELMEAIRKDPSSAVVGSIAEMMGSRPPSKGVVLALDERLSRMEPGPDRRKVVIEIGRSSFMADYGADLYRRFGEASTQEMRDDIAAALARSGNSMSRGGDETGEQREARVAAAKERLLRVYQGASELKVRQDLVRAAMYGLNIGSFTGPLAVDTPKFFRELVPLEPDAAQKERLERLAKLVESGGAKGSMEFDKILYGRD